MTQVDTPESGQSEAEIEPTIPVHHAGDTLTARSFFRLMGPSDYLVRKINSTERLPQTLKTGTDRTIDSPLWADYPGQAEELTELGVSGGDQFTFCYSYSSGQAEDDLVVPTNGAILVYNPDALEHMPSHHESETGGRYRFKPAYPRHGLMAVFVHDEKLVDKERQLHRRMMASAARVLGLRSKFRF